VAEGEVAVTPLPKAPGAQFGTYRDRKTFAIEAAKHFGQRAGLHAWI
jgi:hypothetical protein